MYNFKGGRIIQPKKPFGRMDRLVLLYLVEPSESAFELYLYFIRIESESYRNYIRIESLTVLLNRMIVLIEDR